MGAGSSHFIGVTWLYPAGPGAGASLPTRAVCSDSGSRDKIMNGSPGKAQWEAKAVSGGHSMWSFEFLRGRDFYPSMGLPAPPLPPISHVV